MRSAEDYNVKGYFNKEYHNLNSLYIKVDIIQKAVNTFAK